MTTRIFIDGEAGTTGLQIRERLKSRQDITLLHLPPELRKDAKTRAELLNSADIAILCLPDEAAKEAVSLIAPGSKTRVIDASSAHRVAQGWSYGFPELNPAQADEIAKARLVTNPGCYPQGFLALIAPLIRAGVLSPTQPLSYHAISGYSGGGKKMIEDYEAKGTQAVVFQPYALSFNHKHLAEMKAHADLAHDVLFEPAVGNYAQGMLGSVPLHVSQLSQPVSYIKLHELLAKAYEASQFLSVAPLTSEDRLAELDPQALNNSNKMRLYVFGNEARGQILLSAVYDNLGKGASGAAVQNLNLMIGADPATSVDLPSSKN